MKMRLFLLAVVLSFVSPAPVAASEKVICALTSVNPTAVNSNGTAACAAAGLNLNAKLTVQCDAAAYVGATQLSTTLCTSTTCRKIRADDIYPLDLRNNEAFVSVLAVVGTANCYIATDIN